MCAGLETLKDGQESSGLDWMLWGRLGSNGQTGEFRRHFTGAPHAKHHTQVPSVIRSIGVYLDIWSGHTTTWIRHIKSYGLKWKQISHLHVCPAPLIGRCHAPWQNGVVILSKMLFKTRQLCPMWLAKRCPERSNAGSAGLAAPCRYIHSGSGFVKTHENLCGMHHRHVHHQHKKVLAHNVDMRQSRTCVNFSSNQLQRIEMNEQRDQRLSSGPKRKETWHKNSENKKIQYPSMKPLQSLQILRNTKHTQYFVYAPCVG